MKNRPTWETGKDLGYGIRQSYRLASLNALRAAMIARGFTSGYQLAKASGIGVATVNHLVHGHRTTASPKTVRQLREVLGRDADALFVLDKSQVHGDRAA